MNPPMKNYSTGVVVGRFQVHQLHPGHRQLLDWVNDTHSHMIVLLGMAGFDSRSNPLPYRAREKMIQNAYPNATILPLKDRRTDEEWSGDLDRLVDGVVRPSETVCLYGSRESFIPHYGGRYPTQELEGSAEFWSGTEVRESIAHQSLDSEDFRAGIIYASHGGYPRVLPTVDVALFLGESFVPETQELIMVKKNGETKYRFPGGFVERGESFMRTVRKEIREEVGDVEIGDLEYIGDTDINDWRFSYPDNIHTTFFFARRLWGSTGRPTDTDEIGEVKVFTLANLRDSMETLVVPEHHTLVEMLVEFMAKKYAGKEESNVHG